MTLRVKSIIWWSWVGLSLATLVLTAGLAIFSLRHNNQVMGQLREAVFVADREDGDVEGALQRLRDHVIHHMNSDLVQNREVGADIQTEKPIQLAHRYYRDTLAAHQAVVNELGSGMVGTLEKARGVCEADGVPISERLVCLQAETQRLGGSGYPSIEPLVKDFYAFDYVSPNWSPDLAGWSIVIFRLTGLAVILSWVFGPVLTLVQSLIAGGQGTKDRELTDPSDSGRKANIQGRPQTRGVNLFDNRN